MYASCGDAPIPQGQRSAVRPSAGERAITKFEIFFHLFVHLRGLVRRNEAWFLAFAAGVGAVAGLCVTLLLGCANLLHRLFFGRGELSSLASLFSPFLVLVPVAGGVILGILGVSVRKWFPKRPVDPIEANALQGGRMSVKDSALIAVQTVISNGFGASVGLEAAYTQMGSGLASWFGRLFRLRRSDMRMLVACGSAGAISGAFGAPLTGAFYAFELILGTYTPFGLDPLARQR
jgi:chloride channel protein, CIC family